MALEICVISLLKAAATLPKAVKFLADGSIPALKRVINPSVTFSNWNVVVAVNLRIKAKDASAA